MNSRIATARWNDGSATAPSVLKDAVERVRREWYALLAPVANRYRPRKGASGNWVRYTVRHGLGEITRGERYELGIIFHDAQ